MRRLSKSQIERGLMVRILIILFIVQSILSAEIANEANTSIQKVIENIAVESSIANNAVVNSVVDSSANYFMEHTILLALLGIVLLILFYISNAWIRIFITLFSFHLSYQMLGISVKFPTIDIMYYGFAAWNVSLLIRSLHKYLKKFENKILVTKVNLLLHIIDLFIFILTIAFVIKSFNIQNIEVITTAIGMALFFIVRKDFNNLKSFFIISWDNFLSIGDKIIVEGHEGRILYINKFTSILQVENGNIIKIPNSDLIEGLVINKSKNKNHVKKENEKRL